MRNRICHCIGSIARLSFLRPSGRGLLMTLKSVLALGCLAGAIFTGCAFQEPYTPPVVGIEKPTRPNRILVENFIVEPAEIPIDAPMGARLGSGPAASLEQLASDRKFATNMTKQLIAALRGKGFPAEWAVPGAEPQINDVVVRGCFVSKYGTNAAKPLTVGFDFEALELLTMVEPYQVTSLGVRHGLITRNNPSGIITTSGITTGDKESVRARLDAWAPQAVREIVDSLKVVFQEQDWSH